MSMYDLPLVRNFSRMKYSHLRPESHELAGDEDKAASSKLLISDEVILWYSSHVAQVFLVAR